MKMKLVVFAGLAVLPFVFSGCGDATPEEAMTRAVLHANKGEWEKAAKIANKAAGKYPQIAEIHILRAVTSERCGDRDNALDSARRAVKLAPEDFTALYTLGRLYSSDSSRSSEAEQTLQKAWRIRQDDINVRILLANVAMEANFPRASGYMSMLLRYPELAGSAEVKNQFGVLCVRQGKYKEAQKYFFEAFRAGRKNPEIILNVARFYDGCLRNRRTTAVKLYKEYLQIAGENASGRVEAAARISRLSGK